jgi:integrase
MMGKSLTTLAVKAAEARARDYKLGAGHGLFLLVKVNGAKYWRWKYRAEGKEKTLALGVYPQVSLADARSARDKALDQQAQGIDPGAVRQAAKLAKHVSAANTLEPIAREWLKLRKDEWSETHADKVRCRLKKNVYPYLGRRPIREITVPEVLAVLRRIEARGAVDTAYRVRQHLSQIFVHAATEEKCDRNPAADLVGVLKARVKHSFPTITDPERIGELLRAVEGYRGWFSTRALLRVSPMVFQRPGELRLAEWRDFNLDGALWTVPAARMKRRKAAKLNGDDHLIPLARQVVAILQDLYLMSGAGHYVFPSVQTAHRPLSANTLGKALEKLGFKGELVPHGFRHMADTLLHELGWPDAAIERQLAHVDPHEVRRIYNKAKYLAERRRIMQAWADYLVQLRDGGPSPSA